MILPAHRKASGGRFLTRRYNRSTITHTQILTLIAVKYIKYYLKSPSCSDFTMHVDVSFVLSLAPGVGAVSVAAGHASSHSGQ